MTVTRRAQWRMGTLVEVGADAPAQALGCAFDAIGAVAARMSTFSAASDLSRLNAAPPGELVLLHADTLAVLRFCARMFALTEGAFDISLGRGRGDCGFRTRPESAWRSGTGVALTLDGVAKGFAVDRAVAALRAAGVPSGFVNAGGDLRVFGAVALPVLRHAGRQPATMRVQERAMATSEYGARRRRTSAASLWGRSGRRPASYGAAVLATECMVADALTKAVAVAGRRALPWARALGADVIWRT